MQYGCRDRVTDVSKARADNDYEQDSCSKKPRDASCADNDIHLHIINRLSSLARTGSHISRIYS